MLILMPLCRGAQSKYCSVIRITVNIEKGSLFKSNVSYVCILLSNLSKFEIHYLTITRITTLFNCLHFSFITLHVKYLKPFGVIDGKFKK